MEPRKGGNGRHAVTENIFHGGDVTSTISQAHKQGHLGDLHDKSMPELLDLLERQTKILKNRKFVERLPDKGDKVRKFIAELESVISSLEDQERQNEVQKFAEEVKNEIENTDSTNNPALQLSENHEEDLKIIERGFANLSVHEGPHYQVVVKAESRETKRSKFSMNRNAKKDSLLPSGKKLPEGKEHDLTSASVHEPSHGPAQMISVNECRDLYADHQQKMQDYRADQIADRVLRRFRMVTPIEHPEGRSQVKDENAGAAFGEGYLDSID